MVGDINQNNLLTSCIRVKFLHTVIKENLTKIQFWNALDIAGF